MNIDYVLLEQMLEKMKPRQKLYEVVRRVLRKQGHWKNLPRGKAPAPEFRYTEDDNPMMRKPKA